MSAATKGTVVLLSAFVLTALLDAQGLRKTAAIQPEGMRRDVALAVTRPLAAVSHALYLDRPRYEMKAALGRSGDDRIDATVVLPVAAARSVRAQKPTKPGARKTVPAQPKPTKPAPPPRPAFTPAHPLRIWVAGDSLVVVPGQALERAVGSGGAIDVISVESRVATGLGRPDVFNWYTRFPDVIRELRPRVAVLAFGADDGHNYMSGAPAGHSLGPLGSPTWNAEYRRRLEGVTAELNDAGIYVVWLGLPIIRGPTQNQSFRTINRLLRVAVARHPGTSAFIDTYGMFATKNGRYTDYLRNAHGRLVLMRAADGVHYQSPAGDLIARAVLARLNTVFDLTSWKHRAAQKLTKGG